MELYTTPQDDTYLLNWRQWYTMPKDEEKSYLVVVMSVDDSKYWTVAYTLLVGYIFKSLIAIAADFVILLFPLGNSGTRHVMLASFRNNSEPIGLLTRMFSWLYKGLFRVRERGERTKDWKTIKASLFFILFAVFFLAGEKAAQFLLGGGELQRFMRAPANPDKIFYPEFDAQARNEKVFDDLRRVRGSGIYQAIGRSEIAKEALQKRIEARYEERNQGPYTTTAEYWYSYGLSGFEMGLRDAPGLLYNVSGHCTTNHDLNAMYRDGDFDIYPFPGTLPGNPETEALVDPFNEERVSPFLSIEANFDRDPTTEQHIYNIIPHTAGRLAFSENLNDPWYATEQNLNNETTVDQENPFRVRRFRPPFHCTQNDTFSLGAHTVNSVTQLKDIPGLKLSNFLQLVFEREFIGPVVLPIVANAEGAVLVSTMRHSLNAYQKFDAARSRTELELKRLTYLAFVYSREVVRNLVLVYPALALDSEISDLKNIAIDPTTGRVPKESADFFIDTANAASLDVYTMVIIPALVLLLFGFKVLYQKIYANMGHASNTKRTSRLLLRNFAFNTVHLYRMLDETLYGKSRWGGRLSETPFVRELSEEYRAQHSKPAVPAPQYSPQYGPSDPEKAAHVNTEEVTISQSHTPPPDSTPSSPRGPNQDGKPELRSSDAPTSKSIPAKTPASNSDIPDKFPVKRQNFEATPFTHLAKDEVPSTFAKPRLVASPLRDDEEGGGEDKWYDQPLSSLWGFVKPVFCWPFWWRKPEEEGCHDWLDVVLTTEERTREFHYYRRETRPEGGVVGEPIAQRDVYWNRVRRD